MKKIGLGIAAILVIGGLLPFVLIARSRATQKDARPVHLVMDMDKQAKGKAQRATPMYADERFMRPEMEGTVAREDLEVAGPTLDEVMGTRPVFLRGGARAMVIADPTVYAAVMEGRVRPGGMTDAEFAKLAPPSTEQEINADAVFYVRKVPAVFDVSVDFMRRGRERFNIYCATCHGESGYGDGPTAVRADKLMVTPDAVIGAVSPQNLQEAKIRGRSDGSIFNTITNGIRTMPAYDKQIGIEDRWTIVAYLRALERSQNAQPGDPGAQ
jgi:mono/diheme cytochrome c family protein